MYSLIIMLLLTRSKALVKMRATEVDQVKEDDDAMGGRGLHVIKLPRAYGGCKANVCPNTMLSQNRLGIGAIVMGPITTH